MNLTRHVLAFLLLASGVVLADGIPAQPIGLLDKNWAKNVDQSDFFRIDGPGRRGVIVPKVVFSAKIKDIPKTGMEQRALYVQKLESEADPTIPNYYLINKTSPISKIATYTVPAGTKFDRFITTVAEEGNQSTPLGSSKKRRYHQMFFHVPGRGIYVTEGGAAPKVVRAENIKDSSTATFGGSLLFGDFRNNNTDDLFQQGRFFFGAKDPKRGSEPFIYGGKSQILRDINLTAKAGSEPLEFATLGRGIVQTVYFTAKSSDPADNGTYRIWKVTVTPDTRNRPVYGAVLFTTGAFALRRTPQNLVANGSDLFFSALPPAGSGDVPVLWHLADTGNTAADLEFFPTVKNPTKLTFSQEEINYDALVFEVDDGATRRIARWSGSGVETLGAAESLSNPTLITPANNNFYFASIYQGAGDTYLGKLSLADNSITDIFVRDGGSTSFARDIKEICLVGNSL